MTQQMVPPGQAVAHEGPFLITTKQPEGELIPRTVRKAWTCNGDGRSPRQYAAACVGTILRGTECVEDIQNSPLYGKSGPRICLACAAAFYGWSPPISRRAVATLEEARGEACRLVTAAGAIETDGYLVAEELPEYGGSVSLPDGTTIEVKPGPCQQQMRQNLRELGVSMDTRDALDETIVVAWVATYNAAQQDRSS